MRERAEGVIISIIIVIILVILYTLHAVILVIKIMMIKGTQMVQQSCKRLTIALSMFHLTSTMVCPGERLQIMMVMILMVMDKVIMSHG